MDAPGVAFPAGLPQKRPVWQKKLAEGQISSDKAGAMGLVGAGHA
jgi:hypothetical protein